MYKLVLLLAVAILGAAGMIASLPVLAQSSPLQSLGTPPLGVMAETSSGEVTVSAIEINDQPGTCRALSVQTGAVILLPTSDGERYRGSIAITSVLTEVTGLKLNFTDLIPITGSQPAILGADAQVNPSEPQTMGPGERKYFTITFPKPSLPGQYEGWAAITFTYTGKPADEVCEVRLKLTANQPTVEIEPSPTLSLTQESESGLYKATFHLRVSEGSVTGVKFTKNNLVKSDGTGQIFLDKISIAPETATAGAGDPSVGFTVAVPAPADGGTYQGRLLLTAYGAAATRATATEVLTLTLTSQPQASLEITRTTPIRISSYVHERLTLNVGLRERSGIADARGVFVHTAGDFLSASDPRLLLTARVLTMTQPGQPPISLKGQPGLTPVARVTPILTPTLQAVATAATIVPTTVVTTPGGAMGTTGTTGTGSITETRGLAVPGGKTAELPLTFDFKADGVQAGAYSGNLIVSSANAPDLIVPVEITLKHGPWWPAFALVFGIVAGLFLTLYRTQLLVKDELQAEIDHEIANLNENKDKDKGIYTFYGEAASRKLALARQMLDEDWANAVDRANALVSEVKSYWERWAQYAPELDTQRQRADDLAQQLDTVAQTLTENNQESTCVHGIIERVQAIQDHRHTYADGAAMKKDLDAESSKLAAFKEVHNKGDQLVQQLNAVTNDLEVEVARRYADRIDRQRQALKSADQDSELQAIAAELDKIQADLQQDYQAYPHLYHCECRAEARQFTDAVDKLGDQAGPNWPVVKAKLVASLAQADDYVEKRQHLATAGQLTYDAWRAAWFYQNVIVPVRRELVGKDTSTSPWKEVLDAIERIEQELVGTDYGQKTPDAFDQQLLDHDMGDLFQKLGDARGAPAVSPPPLARPIQPYRDLPQVEAPAIAAAKSWEVLKADLSVSRALPPSKGQQWLNRIRALLPGWRLLSFRTAISLLTVVLLAAVGMQKLWADDPTFGAKGLFDYFTLFTWGLGANLTVDSVLQAVKGWGVQTPIQP
jgi:hypothetical protein